MASRELDSQCLSIEDIKNVAIAIAILDAPNFFEEEKWLHHVIR
jgi:hypothetical protein